MSAVNKSLSPAVRSAVVAHIIQYEVFRHRDLVQAITESVDGLQPHLANRRRSRTTWEVIFFLCKSYLRNETPTTTDIFLSANLSKGTAITCINRLVKHQITEKVPGTSDRRQRCVHLTPPYQRIIETFVIQYFKEFRDIITAGLQDGPALGAVDLRQQLERAEVKNRSKTEFIAHLSHDLRGPLNAILGFSESMKSEIIGPLQPSGYLEFANGINTAAYHLLDLINDLTDITQFELDGDIQLDYEVVDLIGLLEQCRLLVMAEAITNEIELKFTPPKFDELTVLGDPIRIKRAVLNLLGNAIRYTPKGGRVELTVEQAGLKGVIITVIDNGFGIPEGLINTVQEPYKQIDAAHVPLRTGSGLGLAIVKSFVEIHGGHFNLESLQGNGTTARIWLPADPPISPGRSQG